METTYKNVHFLFIGILACILLGFWVTYFMHFPSFEGISMVKHLHGIGFLAWFALLIAQPILIKKGKLQAHRALGKVSYVLVPFIVLSTLVVSGESYHLALTRGTREAAIGGLALNLPGTFIFAALYALAMWNQKNTPIHLRYIIGTSLILIGPGLGRALIIFGGFTFPQGVMNQYWVTLAVVAGLIMYDLFKKSKHLKPHLVILALIVAAQLLWVFQLSAPWQAAGSGFAKLFFE